MQFSVQVSVQSFSLRFVSYILLHRQSSSVYLSSLSPSVSCWYSRPEVSA